MFFQNRLGFDGSYFQNLNKDLLMSVPIAASSGFTSVYMNAATMETKGYELSLNAIPVSGSNFTWDILINFTQMKSMVLELAPGVDNLFLGGFVEPQIRAVAGSGVRYNFWPRLDQG